MKLAKLNGQIFPQTYSFCPYFFTLTYFLSPISSPLSILFFLVHPIHLFQLPTPVARGARKCRVCHLANVQKKKFLAESSLLSPPGVHELLDCHCINVFGVGVLKSVWHFLFLPLSQFSVPLCALNFRGNHRINLCNVQDEWLITIEREWKNNLISRIF